MQSVSILGSTGSIGVQALDVLSANPDRFVVRAIAARSSIEVLAEQAAVHRPELVVLVDPARADELARALPPGTQLLTGAQGLVAAASTGDVVVNGVMGFAGLPATLAALEAGKRLALANKESLITAGPLVRAALAAGGGEMVPVDSEHGALHQCLRSETRTGAGDGRAVARLVVTASGGPFRGRTLDDLRDVTVEEALAHPTWRMGPNITIASSTLFNKGLEVIEAHELFGIDYDRIEVVVHPQSILHSAVEFVDGSTIAQLSKPDMRLPIGYAMGYPDRLPTPYGRLDWATLGSLDFEAPDLVTFRCLALAYEAGRMGGTAPAWLNAANEVAVDAFFSGKVTWVQISAIIESTLEGHDGAVPGSVDDVMAADAEARRRAVRLVEHEGAS